MVQGMIVVIMALRASRAPASWMNTTLCASAAPMDAGNSVAPEIRQMQVGLRARLPWPRPADGTDRHDGLRPSEFRQFLRQCREVATYALRRISTLARPAQGSGR